MVTNYENQNRNCQAKQKKEKERSCSKSISFLLLFFLGERPWFAELQPPRILDLLPWSHPWPKWGGLPKQFPLWYPFYLLGGGGGAVLGSSWGHGGIKSNLLGHLSSFFIYPELLSHVWRTAGGAGTLLGLCFSRSATLGGAPVLELLKDEALMARG